jgi:hypothetical protein
VIIAVAAAVALVQAYEYIFPLSRDDPGALCTRRSACDESSVGPIRGGVDRLSFFGSADSPLVLSTWLFALVSPPTADGIHMFLQCFVGSVFAWLLGRDRLRLGTWISAVAAIAHASFSYPVFGFLFNAALIPFFAWFLTPSHALGHRYCCSGSGRHC